MSVKHHHNGHSKYKKMGSGEHITLDHYLPDYLKKHPTVELFIGSDSHSYNNHTVYVTTLVFRYRKRGAHVVYSKERVPRINDLWSRLWDEMERSASLALHLRENHGVSVSQIDLDYNDNPKYPSYKVRQAAMGYIEALGFNPKTKPTMLPATGAADFLCH
jgi:predicted RNase H-related nuclease YkuK (DUF458 family)